jgi:hypothetical protein
VDRPTRIVAILGERLPRCCEYGAYPARSASSPRFGAERLVEPIPSARGQAARSARGRRRSAPCAARLANAPRHSGCLRGRTSDAATVAQPARPAKRRLAADGARRPERTPARPAPPGRNGISVLLPPRWYRQSRQPAPTRCPPALHGARRRQGQPGRCRASMQRRSGWGHTRRGHTAPTRPPRCRAAGFGLPEAPGRWGGRAGDAGSVVHRTRRLPAQQDRPWSGAEAVALPRGRPCRRGRSRTDGPAIRDAAGDVGHGDLGHRVPRLQPVSEPGAAETTGDPTGNRKAGFAGGAATAKPPAAKAPAEATEPPTEAGRKPRRKLEPMPGPRTRRRVEAPAGTLPVATTVQWSRFGGGRRPGVPWTASRQARARPPAVGPRGLRLRPPAKRIGEGRHAPPGAGRRGGELRDERHDRFGGPAFRRQPRCSGNARYSYRRTAVREMVQVRSRTPGEHRASWVPNPPHDRNGLAPGSKALKPNPARATRGRGREQARRRIANR